MDGRRNYKSVKKKKRKLNWQTWDGDISKALVLVLACKKGFLSEHARVIFVLQTLAVFLCC